MNRNSSTDAGASQLPPHDTEAEQGALACVLTAHAETGEAGELLDQLCLEDFYDVRNRTVYRALRNLRSEGKAIDCVSLTLWVKEKRQLEEAGGFEYVASLPDATPSAANFPVWLQTLQDYRERRADINDAFELIRLAQDTSIARHSRADAAQRLLQTRASQSRRRLPPMLDAIDFLATELPAPVELIRGVLHQSSKLVLGGGSKSFKTWTLLDLALSVAHGQPWLRFETTPGRVLYLNFEIQPWCWQKRIRKVADAKGITLERDRVLLWNLRGRAANFKTLLPEVRAPAGDRFALIILDPIYKLYGQADENKAGDIALLLNRLEELAVDSGAAVAFGAHFSKGNQAGKEPMDRISGSGVFARDPDSLLVFTRHETENAFTVEATLRNFPQPEPFVVRWEPPLMRLAADLDPSALKQARGGRPGAYTLEALIAPIADRTEQKPITISARAELLGIRRQTLSNYLPAMRRLGWLRTVGEGNSARQILTEKAREMARQAAQRACKE